MNLRKAGAVVAVGTLILASILTGSSAAYAAPNPPTVDQTFPDPWITASHQPQVQGNVDLGVDLIEVESSPDGVNFVPYCTLPHNAAATVWFCPAPTGTLSLGVNYIRAIATDSVPSSSAPGAPITITVVNSPTIASPADDLYTSDYQPTFTGTSDGSFFDVYTSDFVTHFCGGTVVNSTWNCTSGTIPDGDYTYLVQTTFGATTIYSTTRTLHIDTVLSPPNTDIDGPPGVDDGFGKWLAATTNPLPTITGIAEPFSTITMWQNYSEVSCLGGPPVADVTGAWSCTLETPLPSTPTAAPQIYVFGTQQTDPSGNTNVGPSPDEQLQLTYTDVTAPLPPAVTSPIGTVAGGMNAVATNSTGAMVAGTGEPGATLNVVGNTCMIVPTIVDPGGNWSCQLTTPMSPDGTYDVFFGQTDPAGNSSPLASPFVRFSIDTAAPATPTVLAPTGHSFSGVIHASTVNPRTVITGTGENGATVHVVVGGSTLVNCSEQPVIVVAGKFKCTVPWDLSPGVYNFGFSQTDQVGNSSGAAVTLLQLTIVSPPAVVAPAIVWILAFASDTDDPLPGQRVTLTGSGLPPESAVSAELHSTPVHLGDSTVLADGSFLLSTVIPETVEPGEHHYVVTVTAPDGGTQTAQLPVTVLAPPVQELPDSVPATTDDNRGGGTVGSGAASRDTPAAPNSLSNSLPRFQDILANPLTLGAAAASSLALLFLVAFPAEILNSTLDTNYDRIFGRLPTVRLPWLDRLRKRLKRTPIVGGLALTTLAALILSFADPHFGFDLASLRLFLACAIGMFVLGYVANAVTGLILRRRWSISSVIELQPFGLFIALIGVVLSRALDFAPGLLIGLVLGLSLSASASVKEEARAVLVWAGVILGLSIAAWVVYSFLSGVVEPETFTRALVDDSLVAVATEGVSGLVIGLLPLGFLDGRSVFRHSRWQWIGTYLLTLIAFFVILVPSGALWGDIDETFWAWAIVLLAFAALCIGVYWWFTTHPEAEADPSEESSTESVTGSRQTKSLHK